MNEAPAIENLLRQSANVQSMLATFGAEYQYAVAKGVGDKWLQALRGYLDLVEASMPQRVLRADAADTTAGNAPEGDRP